MSITLTQIARKAGVSPATVSLALRGDPRVADATRQRVCRLAEKAGYVPNNVGRALRSRRSRLVGYLLPDVTASFYSDILQGIGEAADAAGYSVLTAITEHSVESERRHLHAFHEKRVDGVLVSTFTEHACKRLRTLERSGTPVVVCSNATFDRRVPFVIIDNRRGGALAAEHLIELGHKRLGFCFSVAGAEERYAGAKGAAQRRRCRAPVRFRKPGDLRKGLRAGNRPTGIVACTDFAALEVKHVADELGLRIPEDLSIVGFDNLWFTGLPEFSFTTVAQPKREIGRLSMELLLKRIDGERARSRRLAPALVVRESTGPPAR
jgi:DNA-binding LacI/PurR family transcriptional regulator